MPNRISLPPITRIIRAFIVETRLEDIPPPVIERGHVHILDTLGLALAGAKAPVWEIINRYSDTQCLGGTASVLGSGIKRNTSLAALVNGTAMHADNFDDTGPQPVADRNGGIHTSAVVLPAALAVAETAGSSGADLSLAFHIGSEVAYKLNHAIDQRHYAGGFHVTATLGIFGAAAAAARLLELSPDRIDHALAIAASRSAGLRANFGSMTEQMHTGLAAQAGIEAVDMAAAGMTGAADILETRFGFMEATGGGFSTGIIEDRLGAPWAIIDPGTSIKPWPNGALTHPAMTLLSGMMAEHTFDGGDIKQVAVRANARVASTLIHNNPANAAQARFSMPFCLAALLVTGNAGLDVFTDATIGRTDIQQVMKKISFGAYDKVGADYTNLTTLIEITLKDDRVLSGRSDYAQGSAKAPMDYQAVAEKFRNCAAYGGFSTTQADAIIDAVSELESLETVTALTSLLRPQ
jgi:2-methylcitrate dehydratase PrpD